MPQIDSVTFLSQLFWLLVTFMGFYSLVLSGVLPRLARILKVRSKKVLLDDNNSGGSSNETNEVLASYDALILNRSRQSRLLIQKTDETSKEWITSDLNRIFSKDLLPGTNACFRARANLLAKKNVLFNLMK